ncbi:tripartite tricarboxylate transporter substrate-binding protein [Ramlibacter sp.]|uniref:tripartite tricarboxylate transporter substrate-binding protein n=1 Tax=Ramlibacter sp. TaxID=1917967 RepID=UPI0017E89876|nr:tripartite tricarboxylate transporter substrate-binding protein [Ramlibacter sp.]MBA2674921.1 tripartite tricarboxylate transporter substrate binding protein [Ramlibacter sp.]
MTLPLFPPRPVRYVVPFRAGGPPDAIARLVAAELSVLWGQPVTVDNRPGANGNVGSEFVVHSPPDGCTLLQGTSATHGSNAVLFPMLPYDPQKDLAPVVPLIEGPLYLAANESQPFQKIDELLAHARAHPGELRFATAGPGSPHHLAGELLRVITGIDIAPVHYAGAAQALQALVQSDVEIYFGSDFSAHPEAAKVRLLGVSTRWRWPLASHIPTLVESGIPDFEIHGWFGIFAPTGTPADIVSRVNADVNDVLARPHVVRDIQAFGYRVLGGSAPDFAARLRREMAYWADLVRRNKLSLI